MNWINKLERKFGKFAIPNLMYYIIALYVIGFVLNMASPAFSDALMLDARAICHGQIWRIFTFILTPPAYDIINMLFFCILYYSIGMALEARWGTFRFNLYFFTGMLLHVVAALLIYLVSGVSLPMSTSYLNMSLFLAYGIEFPDQEILLFFILPVKMKWLAIISGGYLAYVVLSGFFMAGSMGPFGAIGVASSVSALISVGNFLLFFFSSRRMAHLRPKQAARRSAFKQQVNKAKKMSPVGKTKHKCAICGRTEESNPELEFRYCSKCDGAWEYCQDHLYTHKHVTSQDNTESKGH